MVHPLHELYPWLGFIGSKSDPSLFVYKNDSDLAYLLLYVVDDIILTSSTPSLCDHIIAAFRAEFAMTDLGPLDHFLGVSVTKTNSGLFLSQEQYPAGAITCPASQDSSGLNLYVKIR